MAAGLRLPHGPEVKQILRVARAYRATRDAVLRDFVQGRYYPEARDRIVDEYIDHHSGALGADDVLELTRQFKDRTGTLVRWATANQKRLTRAEKESLAESSAGPRLIEVTGIDPSKTPRSRRPGTSDDDVTNPTSVLYGGGMPW